MKNTKEWCPHCGLEVEILADTPSPCPSCGKVLLPCSTCKDSLSAPYYGCNWAKERGCWRFPRPHLDIDCYAFLIRATEAKRKARGITTREFARMAKLKPSMWCDIRAFRKVATTDELRNIKKAIEELV